MNFFLLDKEDYTSRPIEQVKINDTPSKSQQLLTITLPKDRTIDSIKNINDAMIINEIPYLSSLKYHRKIFCFSCNTLDGPASQLSISCSSQAVSSIVDLYRHEENIYKTIQIINLEKV